MNHFWVFINDGGADCETPLLLSALCSWVHQHIPPACWEASINSSILSAAILVKEREKESGLHKATYMCQSFLLL